MKTLNHSKYGLRSALLSFVLVTTALLQGCGGGDGDSDSEIADQDPSGIYKDGTAELYEGDSTLISGFRGFVHGKRIIMFTQSNQAYRFLFDGTITGVDGDEYTARVDLYDTGVKIQSDIPVTGTVISESRITGRLGGTGFGSGSFTLLFDRTYNTEATIEKFRDRTKLWTGLLSTTFSYNPFYNEGSIDVYDDSGVNAITSIAYSGDLAESCQWQGTVAIPDSSVDIYTITQDLPSGLGENDTKCPLTLDPESEYTGFASVLSEDFTDGELIYAVTNGENAVYGHVDLY